MARNAATHEGAEHRCVPELPVPGNRGSENEVVERVEPDFPEAHYPAHRLGGKLPDVHFSQRRRLPGRKETVAPGPVRNPRSGKDAVSCHAAWEVIRNACAVK